MSSNDRPLQYSLAINEALKQEMRKDDRVFILGQGVKSPWYVGKTAQGLIKEFGETRVIDTPVSENAMTGAAVGAAISGMRPIVVHPRMDFMLYAFDPIINEAANWFYMSGGNINAPVVIWGVINRYGEQAAQHSQAFHAIFNHIPGLKVVMPATPYDAKGLMAAAIEDENPVVFIDDRKLYSVVGDVPRKLYTIEIGKAAVRKTGKDVTVVGVSYMAHLTMQALPLLEKDGIDAEIIDVRSVKPLDLETILASVEKTGKLVIADSGWKTGGFSADISASVCEKAFSALKKPPLRITLPDAPAPAAKTLETAYYPSSVTIAAQIKRFLEI